MKRIVFFTYSDNVFTQDYIKELLKTGDFKITVIGFQPTRWTAFYKKRHIRYIDVPRIYLPEQSSIKDYLKYLRARLFIFLNRDRFDFIHVHSVVENSLKHAKMLMGRRGKLILTYWGGDIFSKSNEQFMREKHYLDCAYKINVMTDRMREILDHKYDFRYHDKCRVVDFGNTTIGYMDQYVSKYGKERLLRLSRKKYGMPQDKIVIAVGYCGRKQQQHLHVIDQIRKYPAEVKKNIFLYCHMPYDIESKNYIAKVRNALKLCGCDYLLSEQYLTFSQIAAMKMGVDIMVHAGSYDAISASMIEYIYAGKIVLNPEWVGYDLYEQFGIRDIQYHDFEDLGIKLAHVLKNICQDQMAVERNQEIIAEMYRWDRVISKWLELYQ